MNKWLKQCSFELWLTLRNPFFLAMPLVYSIFFLLAASQIRGNMSNLYVSMQVTHAWFHTVSLGIAMLLGILMVRRDLCRSAYEWNRSLPVSFHMLLSAKYMTGQLYLLLFTAPVAGIFYFISSASGVDAGTAIRHTFQLGVQSEISYFVTFALAMLLGVSIPNRVVYLIGFCAWMFGTLFMEIFLIGESGMLFLRTFHLSQFFIDSSPSEVWGYELFKDEIWKSWRFVLAFTFLLLAACLLLLNRKRPTMQMKGTWIAAAAALCLAAGSFVPYASIWQGRYAKMDAIAEDPSIGVIGNEVEQPEMPVVSAYNITLVRQPDDQLEIRAGLEIPAVSHKGRTVFPLTLHRAFEVHQVFAGNKEAQFRRQGDQLDVQIPEKASGVLNIDIQYSGEILEFFKEDYNSDTFLMFSKGQEVNLPSAIAWYPLPGHRTIYGRYEDNPDDISFITADTAYDRPADMTLTVKGYDKPVYTGIPEQERRNGYQRFEGEAVRGASLLSSRDFIERKYEDLGITLITTPYRLRSGELLMEQLREKYRYFSEWMPEFKPKASTIVYLDNDEYSRGYYYGRSGRLENDMLYSHRNYVYYDETSSLPGEWMYALMFGNQEGFYASESDPEADVRGQISCLFWYVYYREAEGMSDEDMRTWVSWTRSVSVLLYPDVERDPKGISRKMAAEVSKALEEGKDQEVKQLLYSFYKSGLTMPWRNSTLYESEEPITYKEWQQKWNEVVGNGADSTS